jgi:hypothetical protein
MIVPSLFLILVALFTLPTTVVSTCKDPISCFLLTQSISIGDISVTALGVVLHVENLVCSQIRVHSVPTSYNPKIPGTIHGQITDGSAHCVGNYKYGIWKGIATVKISQTSVAADIYLTKKGELPVAVNGKNCGVTQFHVDLALSGSISSEILNIIDPVLEMVLQKEVQKIACEIGIQALSDKYTIALNSTVDPMLQTWMDAKPMPIPAFPPATLDWLKVWEQVVTSKFFGHAKQCTEDSGIVPQNVTVPVLDLAIDVLTNGTGKFVVPLTKTKHFMEGQYTMGNITLGGLKTFTNVELMGPSVHNHQTFDTRIGLKQLSIDMDVMTNASHPKNYIDHLHFSIAIEDVDLMMSTTMAVDASYLKQLTIGQVGQRDCMIDSLKWMNVTSLELFLELRKMHLVKVSGDGQQLEEDTIALSNNIFNMVIQDYSKAVHDAIRGFFQGPLRAHINSAITAKYEYAKATTGCKARAMGFRSAPDPVMLPYDVKAALHTILSTMSFEHYR